MGKQWKQWQTLFSRAPQSLKMVTKAIKLRHLLFGRKAMTNLDCLLKSRDYFASKVPYSQSYDFSSSHIWVWEMEHNKEGWNLKNWCFWLVVLKKTLESPLDCKVAKSVSPKGNQSSIFIGRTNAKGDASILWPPDVKSSLIRKDPDDVRDWGQEEKGTTEDKMAGWHHRLNGHEFEWTPGIGDGQGDLACCDSWRGKESDTTERLIWSETRFNWFRLDRAGSYQFRLVYTGSDQFTVLNSFRLVQNDSDQFRLE